MAHPTKPGGRRREDSAAPHYNLSPSGDDVARLVWRRWSCSSILAMLGPPSAAPPIV